MKTFKEFLREGKEENLLAKSVMMGAPKNKGKHYTTLKSLPKNVRDIVLNHLDGVADEIEDSFDAGDMDLYYSEYKGLDVIYLDDSGMGTEYKLIIVAYKGIPIIFSFDGNIDVGDKKQLALYKKDMKMKSFKEFLKEGKEDLPKINKLKALRTKLFNKMDKVREDLNSLEKSLDKFMDMQSLSDKDRKDMRAVLSKINDKEEELSKVSSSHYDTNNSIKKLLGL